MKCTINDIANVISESIPNPAESGYEIFVGLEHYDSGEVKITRYGSTDSLVTAVKVFKKGDILLARRNVYLKRAGLVDFEGVTSGDSIVLRVKSDLSKLGTSSSSVQKYLPFVLNTEEFWNYAEKYSDGTMSKRLSPKTLLQYEFEIPDDVDNRNDLLWSAFETKESYRTMIKAIDEMVKSQFIEMFGESFSSNATIPLSEMVQDSRPITYGVIKPGDFVEDGVVLVRVKDIVDGKILLADLRKITSTVAQNYVRSTLSPGDILLSIRGTIGRTAIVPKELDGANITQDTARISLREEFNNHFIKCVLDSPVIQSWIQLHVKGLAVKGINLEDVRRIPIPSVKNELQEIYIALYHQADKSKFELKQAIEKIDKVMRSLMQ